MNPMEMLARMAGIDLDAMKARVVVEKQAEFRSSIDAGRLPTFRLASAVLTRSDGKEVLISSGVLDDPEDDFEVLGPLNAYLTEVILPVLRPDERMTVRVHEFTAGDLIAHAGQVFDGASLSAHVRSMIALHERQAAIRKFHQCRACNVMGCHKRVHEPPEGYDPDSAADIHPDDCTDHP